MTERKLGGDTFKLSFGRVTGHREEGTYTERGTGTAVVAFAPEKLVDSLRSTPSGEDPITWPIRVLNEWNYLAHNVEHIKDNAANSELAIKTASLKENVRKIK